MIEDKDLRTRTEKACLDRIKIARDQLVAANRVGIVFLFFLASLAFMTVVEVLPQVWQVHTLQRTRHRAPTSDQRTADSRGAQLGEIRKDAQYMELSFPGGIRVRVPSEAVPALILPISTCLILYLNFARKRFFLQLARNVRILKTAVGYSRTDICDLSPSPPWWLVPVPCRQIFPGRTSAAMLHSALGWTAYREWGYQRAYLIYWTFGLFQMAALGAAWFITGVVWRSGSPLQFLYVEVALLFITIGLLAAFDWLRTRDVPDYLPRQSNPTSITVRRAFAQAAMLTVAVVALPAWNIFGRANQNLASMTPASSGPRTAPRFRRKRPRTDVTSIVKAQLNNEAATIQHCGVLNLRSGVLRLATKENDRWFLDGKPPVPAAVRVVKDFTGEIGKKLESTSASQRRQSRLIRAEKTHAGFAFERLAKELLDQASAAAEGAQPPIAAQACQMLQQQLTGTARDLRHLDFIAGASVRFLLPNWQEPVRQHLKRIRSTSQPTLDNRFTWLDSIYSLWLRISTGQHASSPANRRRKTCRSGSLAPRPQSRTPQPASGQAIIERRRSSWFDLRGQWQKEHRNKTWTWKLPANAKGCPTTKKTA